MRNFWPLVLLLLLNLVGSCCLAWQGHQGEQRPKAVLEFDPYGRFVSAQRDAIEQVALSYDKEGRADTLYTPDHSYRYHYNADGELTSIAGGEQPIHFGNYNEHGKPQSIDIGETAQLEVDYYANGTPSAASYWPAGPVFMAGLQGNPSYLIATDHLGTPYGWVYAQIGKVYYTPYSPWGEPLFHGTYKTPPPQGKQNATKKSDKADDQGYNIPPTQYAPQAYETASGPVTPFEPPPDLLFGIAPIGLAGHFLDRSTGLIYMHHRYFSPRLGHFLTPDFRAPGIYDPTTVTEPYAYAAGNPVIFWDPDGLDPTSQPFHKTVADFGGDEDKYVEALIQFLSQKQFLTKPNATYPGYSNFDPNSLLFIQITTPRELSYQTDILRYILRNDLTEDARAIYSHFSNELNRFRDKYLEKREWWFFAQHQIWWGNQWKTEGWLGTRTGIRRRPTAWSAEINNLAGQASAYRAYQAFEGLLFSAGSGTRAGNRSAPGVLPFVLPPGKKTQTFGQTVFEYNSLTDKEIRVWYHEQLDTIGNRIDFKLPLMERAIQAFNLSYHFKTKRAYP